MKPKDPNNPKRTVRYTPANVAEALRAAHGLKKVAARKLGCDWKTVDRFVKNYPECADALHEAREVILDSAELALYKAIQQGEAWAVCFLLKCLGKHRGYVERQEVTGADGKAVKIEVVYCDPPQPTVVE